VPFHHRVIHLFMGVCFILAAACCAKVANASSTNGQVLLWIFDLPVIAVAARAFHMAFGRAAKE
jgi:hypothetical protein